MDDRQTFEKVIRFVQAQKLAVLATADSTGKPEAAVLGFSFNEKVEFIVATSRLSRKYSNLQHNSNVAMVIGWEAGKTVQIDGIAEEVTDPAKFADYRNLHLSVVPSAAKLLSSTDTKIFVIRPQTMKYTDLSEDPWETLEIKF